MNDFTKEELQVILKLISTYDRILNVNNEKLFEDEKYISNKIQSMIDNYCEGENELINKTNSLLLVLGYASSLIMEVKKFLPKEKEKNIIWTLRAIENLVYFDKPLPTFLEGKDSKHEVERLQDDLYLLRKLNDN